MKILTLMALTLLVSCDNTKIAEPDNPFTLNCLFVDTDHKRCENSEVICYSYRRSGSSKAGGLQCKFKEELGDR